MREKFKNFFETQDKFSMSQYLKNNPHKFFEVNGFSELSYLIGTTYEETRINVFSFLYGNSYCVECGKKIVRLMPGWKRGWYKTCSEECRQRLMSKRQMGVNNTIYKMTSETKEAMKKKVSLALKEKIKNGEFTPKTYNYKHQRPIIYLDDGEIKQVRSLWELIYTLNFPHLEYESKRIPYYDSIKKSQRIYIPDFYDPISNTIIEIKPKAYQHLLIDKQRGVIESGYAYKIIDEDYFNTQKTEECIAKIEPIVINKEDVKKRLKWLRKV